mmetsp:Transcript_25756/g.43403  ORF Transcript_25756/g.43403 Transcript_25756/m.43403 type:complete len:432 (-) Transcript_25756:504-1799(-)
MINAAKEDDSHIFFRTNGTNVVISEEWVLPVPVANPHTLVSFTFQTSNGDISFSMVFIGLNGEEEILIPPSRLQSDEEPVHDSVTLEGQGTLILLWDNSYSWLHKKELSYSLQIEQNPNVDANGVPKEEPLSVYEEARVENARKQRRQLLSHMVHLQEKLSGVDDILRTVTPAEIEELEASLLRIRQEIDMKRGLLQSSKVERRDLVQQLRSSDRLRAPLNIRTLNGKNLSRVLQFLEPRESSLVCKYWCQLTAYITEKEENPELTDDDFEILFDYEAGADDGSASVGATAGAHSRRGNRSDTVARKKSTSVGEALSQSQSQSNVPGNQSPAPEGIRQCNGGTSSYSEGDTRGEDLEESASQGVRSSVDSPSLAAVLNSVSQQGAKVNSSSATSLKKMSIADYPDDIKTYLRASLSAMSRMEVRGRRQPSS